MTIKSKQFLTNSQVGQEVLVYRTTIAGVKVFFSDFDILKRSSGWLNSRMINAGQSLLKGKFPDTLGLQDVGRA